MLRLRRHNILDFSIDPQSKDLAVTLQSTGPTRLLRQVHHSSEDGTYFLMNVRVAPEQAPGLEREEHGLPAGEPALTHHDPRDASRPLRQRLRRD